jgi:hypothetical protein
MADGDGNMWERVEDVFARDDAERYEDYVRKGYSPERIDIEEKEFRRFQNNSKRRSEESIEDWMRRLNKQQLRDTGRARTRKYTTKLRRTTYYPHLDEESTDEESQEGRNERFKNQQEEQEEFSRINEEDIGRFVDAYEGQEQDLNLGKRKHSEKDINAPAILIAGLGLLVGVLLGSGIRGN